MCFCEISREKKAQSLLQRQTIVQDWAVKNQAQGAPHGSVPRAGTTEPAHLGLVVQIFVL